VSYFTLQSVAEK